MIHWTHEQMGQKVDTKVVNLNSTTARAMRSSWDLWSCSDVFIRFERFCPFVLQMLFLSPSLLSLLLALWRCVYWYTCSRLHVSQALRILRHHFSFWFPGWLLSTGWFSSACSNLLLRLYWTFHFDYWAFSFFLFKLSLLNCFVSFVRICSSDSLQSSWEMPTCAYYREFLFFSLIYFPPPPSLLI